ncbi:Transport protein particle subunit trs23 [Hypsizygus marmoreus]|uniref:Trafficking protein particle complex subunit n=1 Tax=Hypsizygus marmoreus TaxID=39966 RepID=A0A369JIV0_HYPMA|nr:Transport protein particle subunit trs23 [Hypsizygus marmoreus]
MERQPSCLLSAKRSTRRPQDEPTVVWVRNKFGEGEKQRRARSRSGTHSLLNVNSDHLGPATSPPNRWFQPKFNILAMAIFGLWVINKAGGLVYQRNFAGPDSSLSGFVSDFNPPLIDGLAQLTSNEYLVLAGTLHGIHAITSRLSPMGSSSGAQIIEGEAFKITILLTATGTKFVLLTSLTDTSSDSILQKVYEAYSDAVMKNPFHTPEMPIRSEGFDTRITALIGTGQTA